MTWPCWLTPDESGEETCRSFAIPAEFVPFVLGAIAELEKEHNWEQFGALTPGECVTIAKEISDSESECSMIGQVALFATENLPSGWLPLDGSVYDRVDYPLLYAVIDPLFIIDADTFSVPDADDVVPLIEGTNHVLGDTGGEETHSLTADENGPHTHTIPYETCFPYGTIPEVCAVGGLLTQNTGSSGLGTAHNNMQPFFTFRGAIRAK